MLFFPSTANPSKAEDSPETAMGITTHPFALSVLRDRCLRFCRHAHCGGEAFAHFHFGELVEYEYLLEESERAVANAPPLPGRRHLPVRNHAPASPPPAAPHEQQLTRPLSPSLLQACGNRRVRRVICCMGEEGEMGHHVDRSVGVSESYPQRFRGGVWLLTMCWRCIFSDRKGTAATRTPVVYLKHIRITAGADANARLVRGQGQTPVP